MTVASNCLSAARSRSAILTTGARRFHYVPALRQHRRTTSISWRPNRISPRNARYALDNRDPRGFGVAPGAEVERGSPPQRWWGGIPVRCGDRKITEFDVLALACHPHDGVPDVTGERLCGFGVGDDGEELHYDVAGGRGRDGRYNDMVERGPSRSVSGGGG